MERIGYNWMLSGISLYIPLMAENSYGKNPAESIFSQEEIKNFKAMARELNSSSRGDQAAVFLVKN